jgi:competence protein ComEC
MATAFLIASYYGRPLSIFTCISLTAAMTLLANPTAAIEDIGWQLSFLSLTGIVVIAPVLQKALPKKTKLVSELVAITVAAQIATVPYIMYLFGSYSLLAVVANLVVMPLVPLLMAAGFVAGLAGIIVPEIAYVLASPLHQAVTILFDFLKFLQGKQTFLVQTKPTFFVLMAWYGCLALLGTVVYKKDLARNLESFKIPDELVK